MGTWGSGLWDNDNSLDAVGELIHVMPGKDLPHLLVSWGLRLWFGQCAPRDLARAVERRSKEVIKLPKPLFEELSNIAQRSDTFKGRSSRKLEHGAILGGYCDGYRIEPLFQLPETRAITADLADRLAQRLDSVFTVKKRVTLYEDALVELGVLLELTNVSLFQDAARVERWKQGFAEMNALTTEERPFWDGYAANVEKLFAMLVAHA